VVDWPLLQHCTQQINKAFAIVLRELQIFFRMFVIRIDLQGLAELFNGMLEQIAGLN
jgi:hypothetical protein